MFRPITFAPRGRMSHSFAILSASVARGSPMCQPCSSRPRFPRGSCRLWSGPATKPSSEIDMWQVVSGTANLLGDCDVRAVARTVTALHTTHALVKEGGDGRLHRWGPTSTSLPTHHAWSSGQNRSAHCGTSKRMAHGVG